MNKMESFVMKIKKLVIKVFSAAYAPFYFIAGCLSKPRRAEQCECGDWWVNVDYFDPPSQWMVGSDGKLYRHIYQQITQNNFGVWQKKSSWLGRNNSLAFYRGEK